MIDVSYSNEDNAAYIKLCDDEYFDSVSLSGYGDIIFDLNKQDEVIGIEILFLRDKTPIDIKSIYEYAEYPLKKEDISAIQELFTCFSLFAT